MRLNASEIREWIEQVNTSGELLAIQGKITEQPPAVSGLNFAEACELLKRAGDRIGAMRRTEIALQEARMAEAAAFQSFAWSQTEQEALHTRALHAAMRDNLTAAQRAWMDAHFPGVVKD